MQHAMLALDKLQRVNYSIYLKECMFLINTDGWMDTVTDNMLCFLYLTPNS